jgi:hypothetical protein
VGKILAQADSATEARESGKGNSPVKINLSQRQAAGVRFLVILVDAARIWIVRPG